MKVSERERHDWIIIPIILLIGFLSVMVAGQWALRFSPNWKLDANMESNLDPNSNFLTSKPNGFIEPIDPSILTQPAWANLFLTPEASFATGTPPVLASPTLPATPTTISPVTSTTESTAIATSTFISMPWAPTSTSKPPEQNHPTETYTPTSTPTIISTATATPTPTATPTDTPPPIADLQITKNDGASTYVANGTLTYTVTINNHGPSGITGAVISNVIPVQFTDWNWACIAQNGGASGCDGLTGNTDFNDTVDLPNGASIIYTITANISSSPSGDLTDTASIGLPIGFTDPSPGNNSAADTNQILISNPFPWGDIGTSKDSDADTVSSRSSITLTFDSPLIVGGHPGHDLVYYELPAGGGIMMDHVILQVSDGYNWYNILNWGDDVADTHTSLNINVIGGSETDNRDIASGLLYDSTGVAIELDGVIPNGTYPYLRIISPAGDDGDGCEVDAIVLP